MPDLGWVKEQKAALLDQMKKMGGSAATERLTPSDVADQVVRPKIEFASYDRNGYRVELGRQGDDLLFHFYPLSEWPAQFEKHLLASFLDAFKIEHRLDWSHDRLVRCTRMMPTKDGQAPLGCGFRAVPEDLEPSQRTCPDCESPLALTFDAYTIRAKGFNNPHAEELAGKALNDLDAQLGS